MKRDIIIIGNPMDSSIILEAVRAATVDNPELAKFAITDASGSYLKMAKLYDPKPQIKIANMLCTPNPFFHPQKYITCPHCLKNFDGPRRRARQRRHERECR